MNNNFKDFFNTKVYPKLTEGKHTLKITKYSEPISAKKNNGTETFYITISGTLETGRPYQFNIFESGWNIEFQNPMLDILDPNGTKTWNTLREFMAEVLEHEPFDIWLTKESYVSNDTEKSTLKTKFREPIITPVNNNTSEEDLPF